MTMTKQTNPIIIQDNKENSLLVWDRVSDLDYISIDTLNGSEKMDFGNPTTDPPFNLLGAGKLTAGGDVELAAGVISVHPV